MSRKQTSSELVLNYTTNSVRLGRKVKKILESQLDALQLELASPTISPKRRSEIILTVSELLMLLDRSISDGAKLLVVKPKNESSVEPMEPLDHAEILAEIVRGRSKSLK